MSAAGQDSCQVATPTVDPLGAGAWQREIVLSRDDTDAIARWAAGLGADPYDPDFPTYDRPLRERLDRLPPRFVDAVGGFGTAASVAGVVRLRGIPVPETLPPTPAIPYVKVAARVGTEPVMLGLAMLVGQAMSIPQMRHGHRVHNIYPMPEDADTQKASNAVRLELHTEMAFQERPPDALAILCLRATDNPPATGFCDMRSAWDGLDARERSLLQDAAFALRYLDRDGQLKFFAPKPLVTLEADGPRFQYDHGAHGVTPEHDAAIEALRGSMARSATELTLTAGDLTLIDNRRVAHGRSPMSPGYEGGDRWLQRCLLTLHGLRRAA
jgi:L-asparagine oxygenase